MIKEAPKKVSVNTKEMLMCIIPAFQEFGIDYVLPQHFINAKQDKQDPENALLKLLFDLALLHMFDYKIDLKQLRIEASTEDMITIILAHLIESQYPLLLDLQEGVYQGMNFESSREQVMAIGWIMAVSDFFQQIQEYIMRVAHKKSKQVINECKFDAVTNSLKSKDSNQKISSLCKSIRVTVSNINNLKRKKIKLSQKISEFLKQTNQNISVFQFLNKDEDRDSKEYARLKSLAEFIMKQKLYMRFRNQFWAWLELVTKKDREVIKDDPEFQFEEEPEYTITQLRYNPQILETFVDQLDMSQKLLEEYIPMFEQIQKLLATRKQGLSENQKKQLQTLSKIIPSELGKMLPDFYSGPNPKAANSFVGIQLSRLLLPTEEELLIKGKDSSSAQVVSQLCVKNIQNLDSLKFI